MATKAKQQRSLQMVPNGTSTSRCVSDASNIYSQIECSSNAALDAASEKKTYHCTTGRGNHYVVQAPNPSVAILKMAVLEERLEADNVRKDDKDAYDLRREARKRNGSEARAELSACYTLLDARKYGAERPHWIYTLDLKITEVEDNTAIAQ